MVEEISVLIAKALLGLGLSYWVYNDSRNDPVSDYPGWYSGTIGFVCEFDG